VKKGTGILHLPGVYGEEGNKGLRRNSVSERAVESLTASSIRYG